MILPVRVPRPRSPGLDRSSFLRKLMEWIDTAALKRREPALIPVLPQ
jgi:hypothetical protein